MKICGIVAEYNPFHQGHMYHIQQAREKTNCDALAVITSSYYSQRGLPSLLTLYDKTRLALEHGVDLVIELPSCFACQSADYFAKYAIDALRQLGIQQLCFGSETNNLALLESISKKEVDPSKSYAQNQATSFGPNDILGHQYIQQCSKHHIEPVIIQRNSAFESATHIRSTFFETKKHPLDAHFQANQDWSAYYPYLRLFLQLTPASQLAKYHLVNEGIEYRLKEAAKRFDTWNDFLAYCTTKTYSRARIQRTCIMILLQIETSDIPTHFEYAIVSGFNAVGQQVLKQSKNVITQYHQLPPFLKDVEQKTLALYNSVNTKKIQREAVIRV